MIVTCRAMLRIEQWKGSPHANATVVPLPAAGAVQLAEVGCPMAPDAEDEAPVLTNTAPVKSQLPSASAVASCQTSCCPETKLNDIVEPAGRRTGAKGWLCGAHWIVTAAAATETSCSELALTPGCGGEGGEGEAAAATSVVEDAASEDAAVPGRRTVTLIRMFISPSAERQWSSTLHANPYTPGAGAIQFATDWPEPSSAAISEITVSPLKSQASAFAGDCISETLCTPG